ncbi:LPXTG cell wall anchor domain-containing protein [Streptomyces sp. VRA16 Mangrove soil]|uniref:LPXTG cell wall anchor domain-containing protein n=1 Tax=Streptomyces sp. VRA16 Mangrove soil TaxID=2817434 RepID=UPI001A9DB6DD|nr:LPXTG cell wall anchor domain-containing protein [Streptomyces sp. VRA16 Mangrove soil]MBO1333988.1 LPXTG cell wall anchor domain-containing protein [Streptomyces sp. VRA16 Mangrove soil]
MSSRRQVTIAGSLLTAAVAASLALPAIAVADNAPGPGSSEGGKAMDKAPEGVTLTTTLPKKISVDNSSGETKDLVASVSNGGTKDSGKIYLAVVGFDGLVVKDVPGCTPIPKNKLPKGSNSGFACPVTNLAAGKSKSFKVAATFDLSKTGKICLPVQSGDTKKTYWQQGPVPFGTTSPSPNAPVTPLLLNTENKPAAPAGDKGGGKNELPKTGVGDEVLPLGAVGTALLAAGGAGLWWTRRRPSEVTPK